MIMRSKLKQLLLLATFVLNPSFAVCQQSSITVKARDIAKQMYPGWNLGNTMEGGDNAFLYKNAGVGTETSWQGTRTTKAVIDGIKSLGFKSVRIPTAWVMGHITDESELKIDPAWMARVKEIVDYCINDGLYVILNDHWDGGWLENSFGDISDATVAKKSEQLHKIWTQIATTFRDYDAHLLFAGLNEPGMNGGEFNAEMTSALLKYEQVFIDAVRATGGNNSNRILVVQGPFTDIAQTCKESNNYSLGRLKDTAKDALMVEVHYYTPWLFCGLTKDESWGKAMYYWGQGNDTRDATRYYRWNGKTGEEEMKDLFGKMRSLFADKGYPVIIGECGADYRFANDEVHNASIKAWYKAVAELSVSNGCIPFFWDINYTAGYPNMTIFNRETLKVNNWFMMDGIKEGIAAAKYPY